MADAFVVAVEGLDSLPTGTDWSEAMRRAAAQATNRTADRTRTRSADMILNQVALPPSYLAPRGKRLAVVKRASSSDMEAIIRGRDRPTSLARYTRGGVINKPGVTVQVKPGRATYLRRAFLIRLRAGNADLDTKSNLGLAVRLKKGQKLSNKTRAVQLANGLYILYGPSIGQVFKDVAGKVGPDAVEFMDREFRRLLEL